MLTTEIVMTQDQATELVGSIRDCIARIDELTARLEQTGPANLAGPTIPDLE